MTTIAVIGAGNAGLAIALALQKKGFHVTVFEACQQFANIGGDIGLWANGLEILDKLGVYKAILAQSASPSTIRLGSEDDRLIGEIPIDRYHNADRYPPLNIYRSKLLDILADAVGIEHIIFDKQCQHILEDADGVTLYFSDNTTTKVDLVIGADGKSSVVRDYIQPKSNIHYSGYISMGGIVNIPHQLKYNFIYGKNYAGSFLVNDHEHIFFFEMAHKDCDIYETYPTHADQLNLFSGTSPLVDSMLEKLALSAKTNQWNHYFFVKNYYLDPLERLYKGRLALVGEAAHLCGSIMGCATSMILEGVNLLADQLATHGKNYHSAFKQYQISIMPRFIDLLEISRQNYHDFLYQTPSNYFAFQQSLIRYLKNALPIN